MNDDRLKLAVILSDWCPACLEYKLNLNKFILDNPEIPVSFIPPESKHLNKSIRAIPTTLLLRGDKVILFKEGMMTHLELKNVVNDILEP